LQAVFFGERKVGEHRAILMTRALDGWSDLERCWSVVRS
jgi:hypothetical protein